MIFKHIRQFGFSDNYYGISATGGSTIAMEQLEPWFFSSLKCGDFFEKKIGIAKCHPNDNFNKKIGRETALASLKTKKFNVVRIEETVDYRKVTLDMSGQSIVLVKFSNSEKVWIE